jgi:hypothetical protein
MRSSWSSRIMRPWTVVQDQLRTVHIPHSKDERGCIHTSACMLTRITYHIPARVLARITYHILHREYAGSSSTYQREYACSISTGLTALTVSTGLTALLVLALEERKVALCVHPSPIWGA